MWMGKVNNWGGGMQKDNFTYPVAFHCSSVEDGMEGCVSGICRNTPCKMSFPVYLGIMGPSLIWLTPQRGGWVCLPLTSGTVIECSRVGVLSFEGPCWEEEYNRFFLLAQKQYQVQKPLLLGSGSGLFTSVTILTSVIHTLLILSGENLLYLPALVEFLSVLLILTVPVWYFWLNLGTKLAL